MAEPLTQRQVHALMLFASGKRQCTMSDPADSLHRGPLPSLSYLDTEKIKRESTIYNNYGIPSASMTAPPLVSPSTSYSGPPPPYSYPSSAASSSIGGRENLPGPPTSSSSYVPSVESRHSYGDEKDAQSAPRHSLPPIREALNSAPNISINSLLSSNTAAPERRLQYSTQSPTSPATRSFAEAPPRGPPESSSQPHSATYGPYESHERSNRPTYSPKMNGTYGLGRSSTVGSRPVMPPPRPMTSPPRPGAGVLQNHRPSSPTFNGGHPPRYAPPTTSFDYKPPYQPAYTYPPTTPVTSSYTSSPLQTHSWRKADYDRAEEIRRATAKTSSPRAAYGESVKRHLDIFDIETSLNEIAEGSGRALDFAQKYGTRAHQTQRSGPTPSSLPSLMECDDIMRQQQRVLDSMARIKDLIQRQQQALAEQRIYDAQTFKAAPSEADDDSHSFMDKMEGSGGFAGAEAKKRRGRAAPPGRCHSCNRAETPEWRRGPDGARTLCNACGLHYAKLQRKMDSKDSATGPSKLRPKDSSASSP